MINRYINQFLVLIFLHNSIVIINHSLELLFLTLLLHGCTVEVWEWISNFIPHLKVDVITYPCWDYTYSMLVKGVPGSSLAASVLYIVDNIVFSRKNLMDSIYWFGEFVMWWITDPVNIRHNKSFMNSTVINHIERSVWSCHFYWIRRLSRSWFL